MTKGRAEPAHVRFDRFVEPEMNTGCHLWSGNLGGKAYGRIEINWKSVQAHRFAYERACGPIPEGMLIRHKCDTPACVNPLHLEVGTYADNLRDRQERGRFRPNYPSTK